MNHDPGVPAALTLSGQLATSAAGIDILDGVRQELATRQTGGGLVGPDLLVKDHPISVRLLG